MLINVTRMPNIGWLVCVVDSVSNSRSERKCRVVDCAEYVCIFIPEYGHMVGRNMYQFSVCTN